MRTTKLVLAVLALSLVSCTQSEKSQSTPKGNSSASAVAFEQEAKTPTVSFVVAGAGKKLRGRCHSQITGTDLGFVYGENLNELQGECAKIANQPIVDNIVELPCGPDDPFHGCEAGTPTDFGCLKGTPNPSGSTAGTVADAAPFETVRSCARVPAGSKVTAAYCRVKDDQGVDEWCGFNKNTSDCSWAASVNMTVAHAGSEDIYCWTAWNESHNRTRHFWMYVRPN
jgi:hypothetical protein